MTMIDHQHPHIVVAIERLVLEGLPISAAQAPLVRAALEAELGRLLAADGLGAALLSGGAMPALNAGAISIPPGGDPAAIGRQIAQAVYGGIGGGGSPVDVKTQYDSNRLTQSRKGAKVSHQDALARDTLAVSE